MIHDFKYKKHSYFVESNFLFWHLAQINLIDYKLNINILNEKMLYRPFLANQSAVPPIPGLSLHCTAYSWRISELYRPFLANQSAFPWLISAVSCTAHPRVHVSWLSCAPIGPFAVYWVARDGQEGSVDTEQVICTSG